jgi:hypothetical protein
LEARMAKVKKIEDCHICETINLIRFAHEKMTPAEYDKVGGILERMLEAIYELLREDK